MKVSRQEKILEIIRTNSVETQEELMRLLRVAGFDATQATISRDIKSLKLVKVANQNGTYKYAINNDKQVEFANISKYRNVLVEVVTRVMPAGNLVVVNTMEGAAQAAAAAIDTMNCVEIVGSIAGDDTIFLAFATVDQAKEFASKFRIMITGKF